MLERIYDRQEALKFVGAVGQSLLNYGMVSASYLIKNCTMTNVFSLMTQLATFLELFMQICLP